MRAAVIDGEQYVVYRKYCAMLTDKQKTLKCSILFADLYVVQIIDIMDDG